MNFDGDQGRRNEEMYLDPLEGAGQEGEGRRDRCVYGSLAVVLHSRDPCVASAPALPCDADRDASLPNLNSKPYLDRR